MSEVNKPLLEITNLEELFKRSRECMKLCLSSDNPFAVALVSKLSELNTYMHALEGTTEEKNKAEVTEKIAELTEGINKFIEDNLEALPASLQ